MKEFQNEPNDWWNYIRIDEKTYVKLLRLVAPFIVKNDTDMRRGITPHERLSAIIRFFATGKKDMEFSTYRYDSLKLLPASINHPINRYNVLFTRNDKS